MPTRNAAEIVNIDTELVACDGGGGTLGHPKVYLQMGKASEITCPYCSLQFRLKKNVTENTPG